MVARMVARKVARMTARMRMRLCISMVSPSDIPNNIIYYITSDYIILRFQNEDVFGGAKIV